MQLRRRGVGVSQTGMTAPPPGQTTGMSAPRAEGMGRGRDGVQGSGELMTMTYLSEDPTVLVGGLLLLAAAFVVALQVTQQGKYLIRALVALRANGCGSPRLV